MKTGALWTSPLVVGLALSLCAAPSPLAAEAAAVASGYVELEGGRIYYEAAGTGPALVLIHDGLLHHETWDAQFEVLAGSHRVVRWDRRGYGRSDAPSAPFVQLEDLHALMTALGIERASLVGCSSGSLLAVEYALEHPDRVSSLVLVGPIVSGFSFSEHFKTRGDRGQPGRDATVAQRIDYWTGTDPWILAPESTVARETMRRLLVDNPHNLEGSRPFARWPGFACLGRLPEIEVPTLILVGESDIADVHAHAGAIEGGIEGATRVVLEHSGHLPHLEVPDPFNRLVLDFLASLD